MPYPLASSGGELVVVARHVRCDDSLPAGGNEVFGIVTIVRSDGLAPSSGQVYEVLSVAFAPLKLCLATAADFTESPAPPSFGGGLSCGESAM